MPKLVQRGVEIEQKYLQRNSNGMFPPDPYLTPPTSAAYTDQEVREVYQRQRLTNDVSRASARVYLHTVLSGDYPSPPEISAEVTETIKCLKCVAQANSAALSRSIIRSVIFGICICGRLTAEGRKTWTVNWREVMFESGRELLLV